MESKKYLQDWSKKYRDEFLINVMPFWIENGIDWENGGCFTCLDRDGSLMDSDKSGWFQGRFAFICAYAYNHIEKNPIWLSAAKNIIDFVEKYFFDEDGQMFFQVTKTGVPVRKRRYADVENFYAIALAEYSIAVDDPKYAQRALEVFKNGVALNSQLGATQPKFREGFESKAHSFAMILINTAYQIREAIDDKFLTDRINLSISEIQKDFMKPEFKALLECVAKDGSFIDSNVGRCINPGHCIETAWFILEEAKYRNWDPQLLETGLKILDWSWEQGWDKQYGGILYFTDCKSRPPQEYWHDMKFWWPQCEAIIATLIAYQATKDEKYLGWLKMINEYTFSHFPDAEYKEWFGYLNRDGSVTQAAKGNIFKGPFHIPRMLMKAHMLCDELLETNL